MTECLKNKCHHNMSELCNSTAEISQNLLNATFIVMKHAWNCERTLVRISTIKYLSIIILKLI